MIKSILTLSVLLFASTGFAFELSSKDLKPGSTFPAEFVYGGMGCGGQNVSPELHWSKAPAGTKSFALTIYDPDAPTGSGWWHWIVFNIPASATSLPKGWKPSQGEVQVANDFGAAEYDGPCPPPGKPHHYHFKLHALKAEKLDLPQGGSNAYARFLIEAATSSSAEFTAIYKR